MKMIIAVLTLAAALAVPAVSAAQNCAPTPEQMTQKVRDIGEDLVAALDRYGMSPCEGQVVPSIGGRYRDMELLCKKGEQYYDYFYPMRPLSTNNVRLLDVDDKAYAVYLPLAKGAKDLAALRDQGALITPEEWSQAHAFARQHRGREAVRKLLEQAGAQLQRP